MEYMISFTYEGMRWLRNMTLSMSMLGYLSLLSGCATIDPFADLDEWKEIRSQNFMLYSNAQEKVAIDFLNEFEFFRAIVLKITTIPPFEETIPVRIYLFKNPPSFAPFQLSKNTAGYFVQGKNYIALYAIPFEKNPQFPIIYHEYIHYLISKYPARIPGWFNEGLATIFETFERERDIVTFGNPQFHRWTFMKHHAEWIPMKEFLSDQVSYHGDGNRFTDAHSQAWALMHYFLFGNRANMVRLGEYISLLNNGIDYGDALLSAFGMTPEELMQAVKKYVARDALPYSTLKLDDIAADDRHHSRSLSEPEARQILDDLMNVVKAFQETTH